MRIPAVSILGRKKGREEEREGGRKKKKGGREGEQLDQQRLMVNWKCESF